MNKKTITIPGYKRPALFRELMKSLASNDLTGWRIAVQLEPTDFVTQYKTAVAEYLSGVDYEVIVNAERLGLRENTFRLLDGAFAAGSALCLYIEEDILVARDATRLAVWYQEHHQPNWLCLSLLAGGCGGYGYQSFGDYPALLFPAKSFNSLGVALRKEEWDRHFHKVWQRDDPSSCGASGKNVGGWDWAVYHYLLATPDLHALQSVAARATHIGKEGGAHNDDASFDLTFAALALTSGVSDPALYRATAIPAMPHPVRQFALLWQQLNMAFAAMSLKERQNRQQDKWVKALGLCLILASIGLWELLARNAPLLPDLFYATLGLTDILFLAGVAAWLRRRSKIKWVIEG